MKPYYDEDGIVIYHGDCRDVLPTLDKVDLVLTDPPYGVTQNKWDDKYITFEAFGLISGPIVCTGQNPFSAELICRFIGMFKYSDIWKKSQATGFLNCKIMPLRQHEDIMVFGKGKIIYNPQIKDKARENIRPVSNGGNKTSNYGEYKTTSVRSIPLDKTYPTSIVEIPNEQGNSHPTQKPIKLFKYLTLTYSNKNQTILDPFMGSGTTLVAAKNLGRKAIGIELEEKYCEIAVNRLRQGVLPL